MNRKANSEHTHDDRYYTESEINTKLDGKATKYVSKGSSTQPVYINSSGVPTAISYTISKSVPSNAVFTDTWRGIQNNLTSSSTTDSLSAYQGKVLNDKINVIGISYWSGGGKSFFHNGGGWVNTSYGVTIPTGTYIFIVTASVCTTNNTLYDFVTLGVSGMNSYENQCSFNLTANNNNFYVRCTHSFFIDVSAGTYNFAAWTQHARQFNDVEIAALRIR